MGDIGHVFDAYQRHLGANIHKNPHMAFNTNANACPVKKLTSMYIIGNTANKTECFLLAHGGAYDQDYVFDNQSFNVPQGVTVHFYHRKGDTFSFFTRTFRTQKPLDDPNAPVNELTYAGGQQCVNYILTKRVGYHANSDDPNWDYAANEETYQQWQAIASDADIVIASVRNRWFHAGLTLKSAIKIVRDEYPAIVTFNCLFCRVDDTSAASGNWNWSGRRGVRSQ